MCKSQRANNNKLIPAIGSQGNAAYKQKPQQANNPADKK